MKKILYLAAIAALAFSCTKEIDNLDNENYVQKEYTAELSDGTKTSIDAGKVSWSQGDVIRYYSKKNGTIGVCTVAESGASAQLSMDIAASASFLVAVYGGESITSNTSGNVFTLNGAVKAEQNGKFEDAHVSVFKTYDVNQSKLTFSNVTSLIKFTLERSDVAYITFTANDETAIHGSGVLNFTFSETTPSVSFGGTTGTSIKATVGAAGTYYISTLPTTLAAGFTIKCFDNGGTLLGTVTSDKSIVLAKNMVLNLGTLDSRIKVPANPDLSRNGTANCYIVSSMGDYYFDATVKGNSSEKIAGTIAKAEVLWESFGTDVKPEVGDIVKNVTYEDGKVHFTATGKNGNAVIAVENRDEEILWSWHIWVTDQPEDQQYNNEAGTMMDRNLGATSATKGEVGALGMLYQWGRKDPFLGGCAISYASYSNEAKAESTIDWPSAESVSAHLQGNNALDYSIENPTVFLKSVVSPYDWYCSDESNRNDGLWSSTKTAYDPCPVGYRVPDGGIGTCIWSKAFGTSRAWSTSTNWDGINNGMDFACTDKSLGAGAIWYPASGFLGSSSGILYSVGSSAYYWSSTPYNLNVYCLGFSDNGSVELSASRSRANGCPVRCVKE